MIPKSKSTALITTNKNYIDKQKIKEQLLKIHHFQDPQNLQEEIEIQLQNAIIQAESQLLKYQRRKKATTKMVQLNQSQREQVRLQYQKKMQKAKKNLQKCQQQTKEKAKLKRQHRQLYQEQAKVKRNEQNKKSYSQWAKKTKAYYQHEVQSPGLKRSLSMMSESGKKSQMSIFNSTSNKVQAKQFIEERQYQKLVGKLKQKGLFQMPNSPYKQIKLEPVLPRITKKDKQHHQIINAIANQLAKIQEVRKKKNKQINQKIKNKKQMDSLYEGLRYKRVIQQKKQENKQKRLKQVKYQQKQALVLQKKQQKAFGNTLHSLGRRSLPNLHPITYDYTELLNSKFSIQEQQRKQLKLNIQKLVKLEKEKLRNQL